MMPWWWRLGAGLAGLGAVAIAPYLAGVCILLVLGLSLEHLRFGLACAYWQVLDRPDVVPYATRIRWAGGIGLALAPAAWAYGMLRAWRQARALGPPPRLPNFLLPRELPRDGTWSQAGQPVLTRRHLRCLRLPVGESLLLAAPTYPATHPILKDAVREAKGPLLVIDLEGGMHRATAGWRVARGEVLRLTPFGGGMPWNPLAIAWTPERLHRWRVDRLAALWYPERDRTDRALTSHVRDLFRTLVVAADEVLRAAGEVVPPAPGDLWRLLASGEGRLDRQLLTTLARQPALSAATQYALAECAALDDESLERMSARLCGPLAAFAQADIDAGTRGTGMPLASPAQATVYLDLPYARRHDSVPVIEAFVAQWLESVRHDDALIVIHGLEQLPPLPFLHTRLDGFRCFASVRSLAALHDSYGQRARALMHRFDYLAVHAPRDRALAGREAAALDAHTRYHSHDCHDRRTIYPEATDADALLALRAGEQLVFGPSLTYAMRCRVVTTRTQAPVLPVPAQGEPMPFPKPLVALLAALVAGCSAPPAQRVVAAPPRPFPCEKSEGYDPAVPVTKATLGPHRFCLPSTLFNGLRQPSGDGTRMGFLLSWPSLEPQPKDLDIYKVTDTFLSTLRIEVTYLDRLSDEQYRVLPRRWIEPFDPSDPEDLKRPDDNLHLRVKGEPVHGLTPYYADFDKIKSYYVKVHGPGTRAFEPEANEDWFVDMGEDGIPRSVLKCDPRAVPDGVRMENGRMVVMREVFRRGTCSHEFVIPEYKATVELSYQRLLMPDWRRIETRIRALLRQGEVDG